MIITLEEHFFDPSWNDVFDANTQSARPLKGLVAAMADLGERRLSDMDAAGIDMQVISHGPPGAQGVRAGAGVAWCRKSNDLISGFVAEAPTRFAALASVPTDDPDAGADELQRAVEDGGHKGAMLHTFGAGPTLDHESYRPIFRRAAALGVPIYLHPADPGPQMMNGHYGGFAQSHPMFVRAGWGFMVEAGTQAMRLILSNLFDECPDLQIILGHLGETIPYQLTRIDEALARDTPMKNFREVFTNHFHVTTSGFFSDHATTCAIAELGVDRVMFSVDWPFASNSAGTAWLRDAPLTERERALLSSENARRLLKL